MVLSFSAADVAACVQAGSDVCAQPSSVSQDHFGILVTVIGAGFVAVMGFLGILAPLLLNRAQRAVQAAEEGKGHAASASFGINNDHEKNFRDDFDEFKRNVFLMFGRIDGKVDALSGRVDEVEHTQEGGRHAAAQNSD